MGSCFVLTFYVMFVSGFFLLLFWLGPFYQKSNCLVWFVFRLFGVLCFFRLINRLQKNKLSDSLSWFS